ncbi:MAG: alpha-amylase family protein [Lentisphaeria bacterium]
MDFPQRALFFDFHTMPANPDVGKNFDMEAISDQFQQIGAEYVVFPARCNLGTAYYNTSLGIRHPALQRDLLTELAAACHRKNIKISAYINAGLSHEEGLRHREWLILRKDGTTYKADPMNSFFRQMCYNSDYGDHLEAMAVEAIQHCGVDGLFLDCMQTEPCIGIECLKAMEKEGIDWKDGDQLYAFNYRKIVHMASRISKAVRNIKPDAFLYFNGVDFEAQQQIGSYLEFECLPTGGWGYETLQVGARYLRTLGKPVLNMTGRFHRSWGDFGGIRTEPSLEYDCLYGVANGLGTTIGDHFHPRGDINRPVMKMDAAIYARLQKIEPWCKGAVPLTDLAIVMSKPYWGAHYLEANAFKIYEREWNAICAASRMLCELKQQFNVVSQASDWSSYPLLILPDYTPMESENQTRITQHLTRGGKILASAEAGLNAEQTAFAFPEWGVDYLGESPHDPAFLQNGPEITEGQPDMPITLYDRGLQVKARPGCKVLGEIIAPYYNHTWDGYQANVYLPPDRKTGEPAVTLTEQVAYLTHPIFTSYYHCAPVPMRQLFANLLKKLLPRPLLRTPGAPSFARVTVTSQPGRRMVHFLAYQPEQRLKTCQMIEEPLIVLNQDILLREDERQVKEVYLAPGAEKIPFERTPDGYLKITLPIIKGYALIVFAEEK